MNPRVSGLIPAAGRSTRMGRPKALLRFGDETAIARLVRVFLAAGVHPVRVVVNAETGPPIQAFLDPHRASVVIVENNEPGAGLSDSIRIALNLHPLGDEDAIALCPVDVPLVEPRDLRVLIDAYAARHHPAERVDADRPAIVVPTREGRRGHPALFGRDAADELRDLRPGEPAHVVVRRDPARVLEVPSTNPELFVDLNHEGDYDAALERFAARAASPPPNA